MMGRELMSVPRSFCCVTFFRVLRRTLLCRPIASAVRIMTSTSICLLLFAPLGGCASMFRGSRETFVIDSVPQGADVRLSTGQSGTTPLSVRVPRKETIHVAVSMPGFKAHETTLKPRVAGLGIGLGIRGGPIGIAIDAGTGAMMEHKPNPLVVHLEES
jgi:hypothetical protein